MSEDVVSKVDLRVVEGRTATLIHRAIARDRVVVKERVGRVAQGEAAAGPRVVIQEDVVEEVRAVGVVVDVGAAAVVGRVRP